MQSLKLENYIWFMADFVDIAPYSSSVYEEVYAIYLVHACTGYIDNMGSMPDILA
jgi:hypothetical protein